ncbi:MAG TPA: hypothetical protein DDZ80_04415 [Cyanobacteria bacterium UBA8803]|nr:hypothetical protein [Cyanobacteria bacterium UBA9273]HBL57802.1 hypothetical protein [Cyanobacteria bacterium UBA8803]
MPDKLLTIALSDQELEVLEDYCQQANRTQTDIIRDYLRSIEERSWERLLEQIASLTHELEEIKQEKSDLEILLEATTEHSDAVEAELHEEAVEAKRQTEEQFQLITEATPVPILISQVSDGTIVYANAQASSTFGLTTEELLARKSLDLYYDRSERQELLNILAKKGYVQNYEIRCRKADGNRFWVTVSLRQFTFNGQPTILSAFYDITERKQAEEALREKEAFLQLVLDNIPQLIFWKDRNFVFLGCNRRWANTAGLSDPKDVIGKTDYEISKNNQNIYSYLEQDRTIIETGQPKLHWVEHKIKSDGQEVWFDTNKIPIHDTEGNVVGILGTIEDITERKIAEEALRIAEENYRSIFENALEGIFQSTPDGQYISVNPAMARIYGYDSPAQMMATITHIATQIYVHSSYRDEFQHLIEEQSRVRDFEYQAYRQDGSIIWVSENTRAVCDSSGKLLYYEGIVEDITKRKQEEEALKRQVEELRIEIDQQKRAREVAEITQSDYFRSLQADLESLRFDDDDDFFGTL